ncbi:MAG: hydroxymethylbilane synthase [Gammaproteobacteria bacterium]|nr:hydroxymethylbilane synthase [Gammaproteobacteria bacterium]TVQ50348.1 MAG: hydroxymethylbilane synthase [Gammaproteobacteria bacterium]
MIRIATRRSRLALWQAKHVASCLEALGNEVELVPMVTEGDQRLDSSLARIGGKGLFIKALEQAMAEHRADIAVHSMKDVPAHMPPGFELAVVLAGGSPLDALVSNDHENFAALPHGARIGTASIRRRSQLLHARPDLRVGLLRGNVETRLGKLDAGEFDAIILACAGLERLGLGERIRERLPAELSLPAIGQGVVGIECRQGDDDIRRQLLPLHDAASGARIAAERAFGAALGGDCSSPIAAYAEAVDPETLRLRGRVMAVDGTQLLAAEAQGPKRAPEALGRSVATALLNQGAGELLDAAEAP